MSDYKAAKDTIARISYHRPDKEKTLGLKNK